MKQFPAQSQSVVFTAMVTSWSMKVFNRCLLHPVQFINTYYTYKAWLTNYGLKSFKSYGAKIWNVPPAPHEIVVSFDTFKSNTKFGLDQPANVVSVVCFQLDFPIIAMYNDRTNHNCLLVLNWCCGLIWSIVHDYGFCLLHFLQLMLFCSYVNWHKIKFILSYFNLLLRCDWICIFRQ